MLLLFSIIWVVLLLLLPLLLMRFTRVNLFVLLLISPYLRSSNYKPSRCCCCC